ncbi:hypothetical protein A8926_3462 [Saccharopolyspora spinosa]|uniref:Uncharacterized protein n=1 Tax=Saccharopolyspora spinosa TaxID=60894 RepID=A0A2N3XYE0_SACSN|nr:hypothetical protein A8926_3462 [Saccharopolyspora spinosa]
MHLGRAGRVALIDDRGVVAGGERPGSTKRSIWSGTANGGAPGWPRRDFPVAATLPARLG